MRTSDSLPGQVRAPIWQAVARSHAGHSCSLSRSALGFLGSIQFLDVDEVQDLDRCRCTVVFKLSCDYLARSSKSRTQSLRYRFDHPLLTRQKRAPPREVKKNESQRAENTTLNAVRPSRIVTKKKTKSCSCAQAGMARLHWAPSGAQTTEEARTSLSLCLRSFHNEQIGLDRLLCYESFALLSIPG